MGILLKVVHQEYADNFGEVDQINLKFFDCLEPVRLSTLLRYMYIYSIFKKSEFLEPHFFGRTGASDSEE